MQNLATRDSACTTHLMNENMMPSNRPSTASEKPIKRALISVSDKEGIVAFAQALHELNIALLSTGGTAQFLQEAGIPVQDISQITGFPEMMDGRIKTLHPLVHGGLLSIRNNPEHILAMQHHDIKSIDLLIVNLYPFEATCQAGATYDNCIENIDIGGTAMIRSAAKNHQYVTVIVDKKDYSKTLKNIKEHKGATTLKLRKEFAQKAYARTATYDAHIAQWLAEEIDSSPPQDFLAIGATLKQTLRYGENPHQKASFYTHSETYPSIATAKQLQGKELSYNNINDTDTAFNLVSDFSPDIPCCAFIKHANPCGVAIGKTLQEAFAKALRCDPISAFGSIIAFNHRLDAQTAQDICQLFIEVIIAPTIHEEALSILRQRKNLRILITEGLPNRGLSRQMIQSVSGGYLVQTEDNQQMTKDNLKIVTKKLPTESEINDLLFAFKIAKHVKSNAIVYAKDGASVGIGAGQMSRLDSSHIATRKAQDIADKENLSTSLSVGSVVASDAFFPFADGLLNLIEAGATAIIQPGGSIKDAEVIDAANKANISMVFTNRRHFRH